MDCSVLPAFLADDLPPEARARFEDHLAACPRCQDQLEAALQIHALGIELSQRADRPYPAAPPSERPVARAVPDLERASRHVDAAHRTRRRRLAAASLSIAAACAVVLLTRRPDVEDEIVAGLAADRIAMERVPYPALDRYRAYDPMRAGSAGARSENISTRVLVRLEDRPSSVELVAAFIARGDLQAAATALSRAGAGDGLDVERAIVAARTGGRGEALALLDGVLARSPRHPQALWNRAIVLADSGLPGVAAEAFDAAARLGEIGWSAEAMQRGAALRQQEAERTRRLEATVRDCTRLRDGVLPDLAVVQRNPSVCRPSLHRAVRLATTRDDVLRLLPVAQAIDGASGDTASSELVERIAAADFKVRGPAVAAYGTLPARGAAPAARSRVLAALRTAGQADLVLGALLREHDGPGELDELVRLARASHDPFLDELATEETARAKLAAGQPLEAEAILREATRQCARRDIELRCAYLLLYLGDVYLARHLPTEAIQNAIAALQRARELGLYWPERLLFDQIAKAARFARDYAQMRAYARESELRDGECAQQRWTHELLSSVELAELRLASARRELDRSPTCNEPLTPDRAEIEAELAAFDGTPARIAAVRDELARIRGAGKASPGERAQLDAIEGRLVAHSDPAAARAVLRRAIDAADALGIDDVIATKAREYAYRTLLLLGATDLDGAEVLALFAAAGRAPPRAGCTLAALIDGERLLAIARDATGAFQQVFEPRALRSPDFDARTVVPAQLIAALSACERVDVIALPPLYGQPRLLPAGMAWSYRGPAGAPVARAGKPMVLTIEDARPPAALGLAPLPSLSHEPRARAVDELLLRGAEATPERVRRELAPADFVEIHAHGFVDLGISDVSLIALSPDAGGSFALTARTIAGLELARAPFITLAACHAAYTAPYLHEPWSLPYAFLVAGARGVLAPATAIPDRDAGAFFRGVGDELLRGRDPAVVLRDQRRQRASANWIHDVVLFD